MMRVRPLGWLVLSLMLGACSAGGAPPPRKPEGLAKQYWTEGGNLARRGQLNEAIRKYEQALEIEPEFVQCLNDLGEVYLEKGWNDRAIGVFERALKIEPDFVDPRAGMAQAYLGLGNNDQCIKEATAAIKESPDFARPYYLRGVAYVRKGVTERAEDDLALATQKDSRLSEAHLALGEIYAKNGMYEKAEKRFQAALDTGPGLIQVYAVWANMKMVQGRFDAAYEVLTRGIAKAPQVAYLRTMMGGVLLERGRLAYDKGDKETFRTETEKAMEQFKTALRFDKTDQDAKNGLEEARNRLEKVQ